MAYKTNPWKFFVLALSISYFFWGWIIIFQWNIWQFPAIILGAIGLFGPAVAEIILISRTHDPKLWKDYWSRILNIKRIKLSWLLLILLLFPAINLVSLWIAKLTGSTIPEFTTLKNLTTHPYKIPLYLVFILLFGPLPEELGWRGYGLDALQNKFNALTSSLILGSAWALWHIPLFFINGTFQHDVLHFGSVDFWTFISGPVITSVLFTWIYNNNHRSTLSAIILHFMINLSGELIPMNSQARLISSLLVLLITIIVVILWGPSTLTKRNKNSHSFWSKGICPYQWSFMLTLPFRNFILSPQELVKRLHLKPDSRVLEIGSGPGFFSTEIARSIPYGYLQIIDIQDRMLSIVEQRLKKQRINNVDLKVANASDLPFKNESFDVITLVAVLGEIEDKASCLKHIHRVLTPKGLLSITEQPGDPDFIPLNEIINLCSTHGFVLYEIFGKNKNFTANFKKAQSQPSQDNKPQHKTL